MDEITRRRSAAPAASATGGADAPGGLQVFCREGEYWTLVYAGTTVRLRDAIGLRYLAHLLAHPHRRFAVENLIARVKAIDPGDRERARSTVSKRIRDVLRKIQSHHPALGSHLATCIKTGAQCVYVPDPGRRSSGIRESTVLPDRS